MHIVLMSASGGLKKVHREPTEIARYDNVTFMESTSIENPIFIIGGITDIAEFCNINYAYLPRLGRYYFVNDITMETGGRVALKCSVDVLKTFSKDIDSMGKTLITRQANKRDLLLPDSMLPLKAEKVTQVLSLGAIGLDNDTNDADKSGYFLVLSTSGKGDA